MNPLKLLARGLIRWTKPIVWKVAEAYDLKIHKHCIGSGSHPVVVLGGDEQKRNMIPKSVYFNTRSGKIVIGSESVFGEDVCLLTGKHIGRAESDRLRLPLHAVPARGRYIIIGKGCYIGSRAILIGPLFVGDYAIVAAGAVVTKDVPSGAFVGGVPAREVRSAMALDCGATPSAAPDGQGHKAL